MRWHRVLIPACALLLLTGASEPDDSGGRFVLTPVEGGFLRMDRHTGQVSMCQRTGAKWACEAVADDRVTLEKELDRLEAENRELSDTVKRLEEMLALPGAGKEARKDKAPKFQLPSEEEVDKAMTYLQRMMRMFKDKMRELETDKDGRL